MEGSESKYLYLLFCSGFSTPYHRPSFQSRGKLRILHRLHYNTDSFINQMTCMQTVLEQS